MPLFPDPGVNPSPTLFPDAPEGFDISSSADTSGFVSSPLNEEFIQPQGMWEHYDAYDPTLRAIVRAQKHVDIRDFNSGDTSAPLSVLDLSQFSMSNLSTLEIQSLDDPLHVLIPGEHWSLGSNTILTTHNNWRVLQIPLTAGTTVTQSVTVNPIDINTGFEDDDFISLTLPDAPISSITQASSFIDMTSFPTGDFASGQTASVALSASINPLADGDTEFRVLRGAFNNNNLNMNAITGVRLRIVATGTATLTLASLRLLSKDWRFGPMDINTRRGTLVRTVAPNASPSLATEFTQPIVWRAAEFPGQEDPRPIDFNIAVGFNTGSRTASNQISIYGRELTEDFMQQIDLNGLTQAGLTGHEQPDLGDARYSERLQSDLDPFKQDQLLGLQQFDLERTPDYLSASWIEFILNWTSTNTQVSVVNTEGNGYNFNLGTPLSVNTNYVLIFELRDTAARAAIYPLGDRGQIIFDAPVFDSTQIDDDFNYKRRKGRFGWYAQLADGDAWVDSIRFRSASYAEYRSLPYESLTPVEGAELSAESTPVIDLFEYFVPTTASDITVVRDNQLSTTGESWKITDLRNLTYQGVQSNPFQITDFDQTEIVLDVYYPSTSSLGASVEFYLKSQYDYMIPLPKPKVFPDQWQTLRLRTPSAQLAQTGLYRLVAVQNQPANLNWWIDNVRIFERTVSWYGRAFVDDPWAQTETDWTPFQNGFNRDFGGILFPRRTKRLQIMGRGHKQAATINKIQFRPRYADLGRLIWPEQAIVHAAPTASFSTSNIGRTYTFNGFGSSDSIGQIVNWYWTISDGTVLVGPVVQHTFGQAGTYSIALTVTNSYGMVNSIASVQSVA